MANIHDYMKTKHRQHLSAASLQKQKQTEAQNKIKTALRNVDEAAKAALHPRRIVVVANEKDCGDGISSVTMERRVPMALKIPSAMSPAMSDVTNQIHLNSFDETSKALFSEKQSIKSSGKSYSNSQGSKRTNGSSDKSFSNNHGSKGTNDRINNGPSRENLPSVSVAVEPSFKLSPRRQWELEPFQNALQQFPLTKETLQPLLSSKRKVTIVGRSNMLQSFRDSLSLEGIFNDATITSTSKPQPPTHSVLDLVSQLISLNAVDTNSDQQDGPLDHVIHEETHSADDLERCPRAVPSTQDALNNIAITNSSSNSENNKHYIFHENSNGAGYIISDKSNDDTETIEGSLHFESNEKVDIDNTGNTSGQVDLNASSESEEYDDSFYSED
eukprot:scaffold8447_cov66-Cyclotella_meneghiniana.AAC.3